MLSRFSCVRFFVTLWTVAHQAPMSMDSPGKNAGVGCHALLWGIQQTHAYFPICPVTNSNPVLKGTTRSTWSSFLLHFQLALGDASGAQPSTTLWAASKFMRLNPLRLSTWLLNVINGFLPAWSWNPSPPAFQERMYLGSLYLKIEYCSLIISSLFPGLISCFAAIW